MINPLQSETYQNTHILGKIVKWAPIFPMTESKKVSVKTEPWCLIDPIQGVDSRGKHVFLKHALAPFTYQCGNGEHLFVYKKEHEVRQLIFSATAELIYGSVLRLMSQHSRHLCSVACHTSLQLLWEHISALYSFLCGEDTTSMHRE